jgi:hypothetical protein
MDALMAEVIEGLSTFLAKTEARRTNRRALPTIS